MSTEEVGLATGLIALQLVKGVNILLSILRNAKNSPCER